MEKETGIIILLVTLWDVYSPGRVRKYISKNNHPLRRCVTYETEKALLKQETNKVILIFILHNLKR